jgi:hypothetical protein
MNWRLEKIIAPLPKQLRRHPGQTKTTITRIALMVNHK